MLGRPYTLECTQQALVSDIMHSYSVSTLNCCACVATKRDCSKDDVRDLFCITHILVASIASLHEVHNLHWLLSCKTVMLYCTVELLLGKFIGVPILIGHVRQHCWHRIVGKFVHACFIQLSISPQKSF